MNSGIRILRSSPSASPLCALAIACLALGLDASGQEPPRPAERPPAPTLRADLPFPPWPPPSASPPPADPSPILYHAQSALPQGCLLTALAERKPPALKSGQPAAIKARPYDIVQAPGDPKPLEGTIREERDGKVWFYDAKGIGHPKNPLTIAELAVFKRQASSPQEALRELAQKAGNDPDAHVALAQQCLDSDLVAEAEAELNRALALDPKHEPARLKLADLCFAQGKLDAEIAVYEAAIAAGADSPDIRERLGQRCLELGLFLQAAGHFARAFALAAKASAADVAAGQAPLPPDPLPRRLLRQVAEARFLQGRAPDAEPILKLLAVATPDDPALSNLQALADLLAGRAQQAAEALRKLVEAPEPPVSARNNLGALLFNSADHDAALAQFQACLTAAPHHAKATLNTALALAALGRLDEAQKALASLSPPPINSLHYWLVSGYLQERQGSTDGALNAYQKARGIERGCACAVKGVARCHLAKNDPKLAGESLEEARLLDPDDPEALRGLGTCRYQAGQLAPAAEVFRQLAARRDAEPRDLIRLGLTLLRFQGASREASRLFERAVAASRSADPYALAAAAYAANAAGATDPAEAHLRQAALVAGTAEAAKYAADAIRRIFAARGEEPTTIPFGAAGATALPEGWRPIGQGNPAPEVRNGELRFEGSPQAANERAVVLTVPLVTPAEKGPVRAFARFDVAAHIPITTDATVGVLLGAGQTTLQLALRTTRQPQLSRRLAYRILRGKDASPWADLPDTVALERLRIGLALSTRAKAALDVRLNGILLGQPIPLDALADSPKELTVGLFAAAEPQQQCLFAIREIELVWKGTPAGAKTPEPPAPSPKPPTKTEPTPPPK
jgi:tetratricopeptide (TPR) repeat protein